MRPEHANWTHDTNQTQRSRLEMKRIFSHVLNVFNVINVFTVLCWSLPREHLPHKKWFILLPVTSLSTRPNSDYYIRSHVSCFTNPFNPDHLSCFMSDTVFLWELRVARTRLYHPLYLSVRLSVGWLVCLLNIAFWRLWTVFMSLHSPECFISPFRHCPWHGRDPCSPARDYSSRVSGRLLYNHWSGEMKNLALIFPFVFPKRVGWSGVSHKWK